MQKQYNVLRYGIELYFHESNLATESDENGYNNRNVDYETKKKKKQHNKNLVGSL